MLQGNWHGTKRTHSTQNQTQKNHTNQTNKNHKQPHHTHDNKKHPQLKNQTKTNGYSTVKYVMKNNLPQIFLLAIIYQIFASSNFDSYS